MGEGCPNDAALMDYVSSANIACGFHAGDAGTMRRTVDLAVARGVAIGAHPGYHDPQNFGRVAMHLPAKQVFELVIEQISALSDIAAAAGTRLAHVKPHGALYNQAARDTELSAAIAEAVCNFDDDLILFGLAGSVSLTEAAKAGLTTAAEVFADRTYQNDGSLTPRTRSDALIADEKIAAEQAVDMVKYGRVRSTDGIMVAVRADTICLHGDGEMAVVFARTLRQRLEINDIEVSPFTR
jgi:UPF0271 protein